MVISHEHKFVFFHTPKTGGSTVNQSLFESGHRENYVHIDGRIENMDGNHIESSKINQHTRPVELFGMMPDFDWHNYFKFAFVRNPYSLEVSKYFYCLKIADNNDQGNFYNYCVNVKNDCKTFDDFVRYDRYKYDYSFKYYLCKDGELMVDYVGKLETMQKDYMVITAACGIDSKLVDSKINKTNHDEYQTYYNKESQNIVKNKYIEDIEFFRYEF